MAAFFPPISRDTRLPRAAHFSATRSPTSVDPVKEMRATSGWSTRAAPVSSPPSTRFSTPGGTPASSRTSTNFTAQMGTSGAGLNTTVFPHTRAGTIFHDGMARGKFHGVITPTTPRGWRTQYAALLGISLGVV
ncbi:hypothetical protein HRbin32_02071 [bacterium HR32]|nr:hypothetical protein HRbin32_02071 [bacterium HR32]